MSHYSDLDALHQGVQSYHGRSDATFVAELPGFTHLAEQRIYFGGADPLPSDPLRVVETVIRDKDVAIVDGVVNLPADFLSNIKFYIDRTPRFKTRFVSNRRFYDLLESGTSEGYIVYCTVVGKQILVGPRVPSENAKLTYFSCPPHLEDPTDTNTVLETYPNVYLQAMLIESFGWERNNDRAADAYQKYVSAVNSANFQSRDVEFSGSDLEPKIDGAIV